MFFLHESERNNKIAKDLVFRVILDLIGGFFKMCNEGKVQLYNIKPFRESTYTKLIELIGDNKVRKRQIFESLYNVIKNTIRRNLPDESHIKNLYPAYRNDNGERASEHQFEKYYESAESWREFVENYPKYFIDEIKKAIRIGSQIQVLWLLSLYKKCIFPLAWRTRENHKHLKSLWIKATFSPLLWAYQDGIRNELIKNLQSYQVISQTDITELFKDNDWCAEHVLYYYLDFIVWLNKQGKLSYKMYSGYYLYSENTGFFSECSLLFLGSHFAEQYHDGPQYSNGLSIVLETISTIFEDYKRGIQSEDVDFNNMILVVEKIKESYLLRNKENENSIELLGGLKKILFKIQRHKRNI